MALKVIPVSCVKEGDKFRLVSRRFKTNGKSEYVYTTPAGCYYQKAHWTPIGTNQTKCWLFPSGTEAYVHNTNLCIVDNTLGE